MKLVLCSEGFHTPNTVQACVELTGKPQNEITIAIINEAYAVEAGDKRCEARVPIANEVLLEVKA